MENYNDIKLRYIDMSNFLPTRALVSQISLLVVSRDSNSSYYLNLSIHSPMVIIAIM